MQAKPSKVLNCQRAYSLYGLIHEELYSNKQNLIWLHPWPYMNGTPTSQLHVSFFLRHFLCTISVPAHFWSLSYSWKTEVQGSSYSVQPSSISLWKVLLVHLKYINSKNKYIWKHLPHLNLLVRRQQMHIVMPHTSGGSAGPGLVPLRMLVSLGKVGFVFGANSQPRASWPVVNSFL